MAIKSGKQNILSYSLTNKSIEFVLEDGSKFTLTAADLAGKSCGLFPSDGASTADCSGDKTIIALPTGIAQNIQYHLHIN